MHLQDLCSFDVILAQNLFANDFATDAQGSDSKIASSALHWQDVSCENSSRLFESEFMNIYLWQR